ncbi:aminotransferase class I/II-fold pyridoxal phosphate-dependent enzyme [Planococcus lenghuensis]|uniref:Lysine decarboxylase n=1 Tax=Planococcus lenghuensis TaxID=2213202 RepID=A0A1Q2KU16_9BACL|nr:aminotransferase class I/II-fold pyridoxal phosphate-dependent enzyme [Planococcus lenghuensis]AQQ51698.1 lysine decarboxylase [Planococcus lenghuensis]
MQRVQRRPLVDALLKFQQGKPVSFHVPGHKNGLLSALPEEVRQAMKYDVTELPGLDDLHYPEEAIREAQELLQETYGAQHSFFLVNGSTAGNLAMVLAACEKGDTVLVQRNSHKSIFHSIEFAQLQPVYLTPEWDERTMTATHVSLKTVQQAFAEYPNAKALILTYPNYYGMTGPDLKSIILLAHARGIPVLVDEAHGAHFTAGAPFPKSALALGADAVVQSAHKTLPAMTMGSFLHIRSELLDTERVMKYLRMIQSSSPSYLIMASLDDARAFIQTYSRLDSRYLLEKRQQFIDSLKTIDGLITIETADPLKLILRAERVSGYDLKEALEQEGIYPELADPNQVLFVLPLLKVRHSYPFAGVRSRIKEVMQALEKKRSDQPIPVHEQPSVTTPEVLQADINKASTEWIPVARAIGRIAAGAVIPYPPGIPLVVPGEKWTTTKLEELMDFMAEGATLQGEHRLEDKLLYVLQEDQT